MLCLNGIVAEVFRDVCNIEIDRVIIRLINLKRRVFDLAGRP